ncbi:hypothetical protein BAGQ_1381 [Bacillus velezensis]|nr:hypothetical protein BCBMB205_12830 [Bacillus velezensis]ARZ57615.1 hypothetical protein BAGQ_1381 [Bacillus velezensis]
MKHTKTIKMLCHKPNGFFYLSFLINEKRRTADEKAFI